MPFTFFTDQEPVSVNRSNNKAQYKAKKDAWIAHLQSECDRKYPLAAPGVMHYSSSEHLYFLLTYYTLGQNLKDVDNLLKIACDSFKGRLFPNDDKVHYFVSQAVELRPNCITGFTIDGLPEDALNGLLDFIRGTSTSSSTTRTYIECGRFQPNMIKYNLEEVWK